MRGGIDVGGTNIQAAVIDQRHRVMGKAKVPTPRHGGPAEVVEAMCTAVRLAADKAEIETPDLVGVGAGLPGAVDSQAGTLARASNLPNWKKPYPLAAKLEEELGCPAFLGNDVGVALEAECRLGAGRGFHSLLGVFWGTGVGGGIVLNGQRWTGRHAAGEFGHLVIERNGRPCACGGHGHLEAYAGRRAMEARARKKERKGVKTNLFTLMKDRKKDRLTSGVWERAVRSRDPLAGDILHEALDAIAAGMASAINLLDVEAVVLGGGMGLRFGLSHAGTLQDWLKPRLFNPAEPPALLIAGLGDLGGSIGAALLVPEA